MIYKGFCLKYVQYSKKSLQKEHFCHSYVKESNEKLFINLNYKHVRFTDLFKAIFGIDTCF